MNKLKRYTLGRVTLAKTENSSLQGAGIVECDHGEFYRCADIWMWKAWKAAKGIGNGI